MMQYIYPKFYSLHDMPDNAGLPDEATGEIFLPLPINLSSERLVPYGMYLIDDGQTQFLWVGRDAVPALLKDVFGVDDKTQLKQGKTSLMVLDNEFNERVRAVVDKSKDHRAKGVGSIVVPPLYLVREDGEPSLKLWAQTMLVEDRADQAVSLQQWMGMLREKVRLIIFSLWNAMGFFTFFLPPFLFETSAMGSCSCYRLGADEYVSHTGGAVSEAWPGTCVKILPARRYLDCLVIGLGARA